MRPGVIGLAQRPPSLTARSRSWPGCLPWPAPPSSRRPGRCARWTASAYPALQLLGTPLCDRELHGLNAGLRIPAGSTGGLVIGGARYMRLWEVLDAYWRLERMA